MIEYLLDSDVLIWHLLTYNVKHYPMPEVTLYGFDTPAATQPKS
jgi:hypothetical protein